MGFIKKLAYQFSTQFVLASSLIVFSTGLWMFYVQKSLELEEVHSHLGIVFFVAAIFHIVKNWVLTKKIFKNNTVIFVALLTFSFSGLVYYIHLQPDGQGPGGLMQVVMEADIETVSKLYKIDTEVVIANMEKAGVKVRSPNKDLRTLAKENNMTPKLMLQYFYNDSKLP